MFHSFVMEQSLSKELTRLVDESVSTLGQVIEDALGAEAFSRIEKIRRFVKSPEGQSLSGLTKLKEDLRPLSKDERYAIAHAFSLMLELINSCETAYRRYRLKEEEMQVEGLHSFGRIIHVLTAHPTESRNPDIIFYFKKIQDLLQKQLESPQESFAKTLYRLLRFTWFLPMSKQKKPSVMDEAEYIYSLALQDDILKLFIVQNKKKQPFYLRTWVGGDKDGHPGVDEKTMLGSLQMARKVLYHWVERSLQSYLEDLLPLHRSSRNKMPELQRLLFASQDLRKKLRGVRRLSKGDARRLQVLKEKTAFMAEAYKKVFLSECPVLEDIVILFKIFPGLVVPLELREDSALVHEALKSSPAKFAISRMLKTLAHLSPEHDPRFYIRGFVLSQTESVDDMTAGLRLVEKYLGKAYLPVVPLFESAHSLERASEIVEEFLQTSSKLKIVQEYWSGKFEVMLGYSDSAKENGAFPSRFLISTAIAKLAKVIEDRKLQPIFFHGSGGSVERGGGSVQEQTEWWPTSALSTVKVTVQGEMIYRSYVASEILQSQLERFAQARDRIDESPCATMSEEAQQKLARLSEFVQGSYRGMLKDPHFLQLIESATPYSFLKDLKMGSRPSKRQTSVSLKSLRAIPWVLCWTQTRALFPTWWGVGQFWSQLSSEEKKQYRKIFAESSLFRSYIKVLGFTLEKMDLNVFSLYLHSSKLPREVVSSFEERFSREFDLCQQAVREITGQKSFLWYRPWLETSIHLRSPLIHPISVLQLLALEDHDIPLLRETVTGVASGMLTTG